MILSDSETYEIIEKYEQLLYKFYSRVDRLCTIEDFKSEVFLRVRGRMQANPKLHFNYLSMVANQLSGLIYKNLCRQVKFNKNLNFKEIEDQLMTINTDVNKKNINDFKNRYSSIKETNLIQDMSSKFNEIDFKIIEMLSEGYNKTEIIRSIGISSHDLYKRIEEVIKPRINAYISGESISMTGVTECDGLPSSD